jgi:hypothetical protein
MPINAGIANCAACGAQVGTVFSETDFVPEVRPSHKRKKPSADAILYEKVESAKDRANSSLIFALSSFLPFISYSMNGFLPFFGSILAIAAIVYGALGLSFLSRNKIEDCRGSAIGGIVVGIIGVIAQVGYLIYFLKIVSWNPLM